MKDRKPYQKPALVAFGDLASLTQRFRKQWGPGDFFWLFRPRRVPGPDSIS